MRAHATIVAEADARGTRIARLRSESPLLLRHTPAADGMSGVPVVHLVAGAAGPIGGDQLRLDIEVRPGAALEVRTVAASVALPGRTGAASSTTVRAVVADGGALRWLPEPLVAAAGCRHSALSMVEMAEEASLVWRDELVCGRHGEEPGDATVTISVRYAGRPLLRQTLAIGPSAVGWPGAAMLGGAGATGSLLRVAPGAPPPTPRVLAPTAVLVPLAGPAPASLITATAADAHTLRRHLAGEGPGDSPDTHGPDACDPDTRR